MSPYLRELTVINWASGGGESPTRTLQWYICVSEKGNEPCKIKRQIHMQKEAIISLNDLPRSRLWTQSLFSIINTSPSLSTPSIYHSTAAESSLLFTSSATMAKAYSSSLSLICFLLFFHGCFAQIERVTTVPRGLPPQQRQQRPQREECQLERIIVVEPNRRIQSEAGVTDVWDENDDQFQCAGVVPMRHVIQERGLCCHNTSMDPSSYT